MVVQLLGDFGSQKRIAHLTNMQPGATTFYVTTVGRPIRKLIAISLAHLRDGTSSVIHKIGTWSIHILGVEFPQPSIIKLILADEGNLVGMILTAIAHVPCLHLS